MSQFMVLFGERLEQSLTATYTEKFAISARRLADQLIESEVQ